MRKLWILLVVLAVMGAAPLFAEVNLSGEFMGFVHWDFQNPGASAFPKIEFNGTADIDDFNTLKFELDSEGTDFRGLGDLLGAPEDAMSALNALIQLDDIRLVTDWGAALGLPVGITTTIGYFDTYFTGWYYYDASGWTWYYPWDNKVVQQGPDGQGAMQVDIAAGPVNIHWYNDGAGDDFMVGADAAFAGANVFLAYGSTFGAFGDGDLSVEAAYAIMDMANVGAFFRYGLGDSAWTYGVNLGANFGMFHAAAGLEGDSVDALDNIVVEATVAPVDAAKIAVVAFMDLGGEAFAALDVSAAYKVGAANFVLGYMYRPDGAAAAPVYFSADNYSADGLYAGVDIDF